MAETRVRIPVAVSAAPLKYGALRVRGYVRARLRAGACHRWAPPCRSFSPADRFSGCPVERSAAARPRSLPGGAQGLLGGQRCAVGTSLAKYPAGSSKAGLQLETEMVAHELIVLVAREFVVLVLVLAFVVWIALRLVRESRR
jgi:hypothetical protein